MATVSLILFIIVYALLEGELHALIHNVNLNNPQANTRAYQRKFHFLAFTIRFLVSFTILFQAFQISLPLVRYLFIFASIWLLVFDGWVNLRRGLGLLYVGQNALSDRLFHYIARITNVRAQFISVVIKVGFLITTLVIN